MQRQRRSEAQAELQAAAEMLDALPSLDDWRRYWRGRIADALGNAAEASRFREKKATASAASPGYDESRLPGQAGALARRVS